MELLSAQWFTVVTLGRQATEAALLPAMRSGIDAIAQAPVGGGVWFSGAAMLRKVPGESVLGDLAAAGVNSMFIEPGSPWQSPFAETLHAQLRVELLNHELLTTVLEADVMFEEWR